MRVEIKGLEEQADNAKPRELWWKPLSWIGTLRPTTVNDAWDPALWQTFFYSTLGLEVPALLTPRHNNQPTAVRPVIRCEHSSASRPVTLGDRSVATSRLSATSVRCASKAVLVRLGAFPVTIVRDPEIEDEVPHPRRVFRKRCMCGHIRRSAR